MENLWQTLNDTDVKQLPITPPKASAEAAAAEGGGEIDDPGGIEEDVVAESPEPAPVDMQSGK